MLNDETISNSTSFEDEKELPEWWGLFEDNEKIRVYVYRKTNNNTYEQVNRIDGYVPDPHDIGLQLGSGSYKVIIKYPIDDNKLSTTTKYFTLGKQYDNYNSMADNPILDSGKNNIGYTPELITKSIVTGLTDTVKELFPLVAPFFAPKKEPTFGEALNDVYSSTSRIIEENMKQNNKMLSGIMKEMSSGLRETMQNLSPNNITAYTDTNIDNEYEDEGEDNMSIIGKMAWGFLEPHIVSVVNGSGDDLIAKFKDNAIFRSVIDNPQVLKEIQMLILDKFGRDTLEIIMSKLGQ